MDNQIFKNIEGKNKTIFISLIAVLNIFLLALTVSTVVGIQNKVREGRYIGQDVEAKNTISVSGKGEVYVKPDLAVATFSVVTEKKTVAEAVNENAEKMNAVIDFMKQQGIKDRDLKTANFSIYPRYEWRKGADFYPQGKRVLVGYEVNQSLQAKIRDMAKIGSILKGAADKGANSVGDLRFTVDEPEKVKSEARKRAIQEAKNKAEEIASQLGVRLVRITGFNESSVPPRYYGLEKSAVGMGGGESLQPQIETGENKIEVNVTITYEIR
ncbi:MAG TPA: SIMPL domain-containing protein [Candidatus Parcubacteria bacterium]|nr:SIMPL domain-containing protein [Candidatus Parcubacteria bacterium]